VLSRRGKHLVLFVLFALVACSRNKPTPSLTASAVAPFFEVATHTAAPNLSIHPLTDTTVPYPTPGHPAATLLTVTSVPYPAPEPLPPLAIDCYPWAITLRNLHAFIARYLLQRGISSTRSSQTPLGGSSRWMFDARTGWAVSISIPQNNLGIIKTPSACFRGLSLQYRHSAVPPPVGCYHRFCQLPVIGSTWRTIDEWEDME
jgi:hypothetical protein